MASRSTLGLPGDEQRVPVCADYQPPLPLHLLVVNTRLFVWVRRLRKLWGLLEGISSMAKQLQQLLQTVVPGWRKAPVARR